VAKTLGVAARPDVQAIVDAANAETAVLRNQVIGTQANDVLRDPTRLHESEMGNMVTDASEFNRRLTEWLVEYNFRRPHQSLQYMSPINFIYKYDRLLPMYPSSLVHRLDGFREGAKLKRSV